MYTCDAINFDNSELQKCKKVESVDPTNRSKLFKNEYDSKEKCENNCNFTRGLQTTSSDKYISNYRAFFNEPGSLRSPKFCIESPYCVGNNSCNKTNCEKNGISRLTNDYRNRYK